MKKGNLLGRDEEQLADLARELGAPAFRGRQLYRQIYCRRQLQIEQMTDLSLAFRRRLAEEYEVRALPIERRTAAGDRTIKYLMRLRDGRYVEAVRIPEERRQTLCISSQAGCGVGCSFCMTAVMGFQRNLRADEILGQVLAVIAEGELEPRGFNIVFMGMGEPLFNYRNVMKAFRLLIDRRGMGFSHHKVTLSTAGVVPVLRRLRSQEIIPNLAISLNAAEDSLRTRLMPLNARWGLEELLEVCRSFSPALRKRITFEYVLLKGVNDSAGAARKLTRLLGGMRCKVNLIPYNPNPGLPFQRPPGERMERFQQILREAAVSAYVRRPRGDSIGAACGQLAHLEAQAGVNDAA